MPDQARAFGAHPDDRPRPRKVPQLHHRQPGQHVELAEGSRDQPRGSDSYHAAPLEQLADAHQRMADSLPNPLSDNVHGPGETGRTP